MKPVAKLAFGEAGTGCQEEVSASGEMGRLAGTSYAGPGETAGEQKLLAQARYVSLTNRRGNDTRGPAIPA